MDHVVLSILFAVDQATQLLRRRGESPSAPSFASEGLFQSLFAL